jgi:3-phenylpropionate/cinnamic acid dioxygenase small subunit
MTDPVALVQLEARLIDEQRFDEWLALFTPDARYWMPLEMGQTDPILHNSLFYDDLLLLRIRVERLKGAKTYSQKPKSRCHHLLGATTVEGLTTWTPFHYVETRLDEQTLYAGWAAHTLVQTSDGLRIKLKRIDLVNPDSAFGNIQLFM